MFLNATFFVVVLLQVLPALCVVHEQLPSLPAGWTAISAAGNGTAVSFTVALIHQNIDQLESKLASVSTPGSETYGHYMEVEDLNSFFAPTPGASSAVESWLRSAGVSQISSDGAFVTFATTVGTANSLLNTTFVEFENSGISKIRTTEYSIPEDLVDYIDLIDPTVYFGKTTAAIATDAHEPVRRDPAKRSVDDACETLITPICIKELYSVGDYTPEATSGSQVGFSSFDNQTAIYSDLFVFEQLFNITQQNISTVLIAGATNDQDLSTASFGEGNLDSQIVVGLSNPLPVTEFITGGSPPFVPNVDFPLPADNYNEPYLPFYQYLLSQPNSALPQVISNSYADDEQTVPEYYATRVCNMIGMMGLRGISILEASGDTGVGVACQSNDGNKTPQFTPQFPATCPYITSVGGTVGLSPETGYEASGGGFSNYFARPVYQQVAIETYLNSHISSAVETYYTSFTNFSGRGFPDVSAHSGNPSYGIVYAGGYYGQSGTSTSCPAFASIIALLNDARLRVGKSTLGFLNPLLYAIGSSALNDITSGTSVGCTDAYNLGGSIIPYATWNATVGWDPVTGLGTPNFEKLKALVLTF